MTYFGKFILLLLKVTLTSFQSISLVSQIEFQFNFTLPGFIVPAIVNRWMLPTVLHSSYRYIILYI